MANSEIFAEAATLIPGAGSTLNRLVSDATQRDLSGAELEQALPPAPSEETVVVDDRSALSPAQVVESKLSRILEGSTLPVSHLQMRGLLRNR